MATLYDGTNLFGWWSPLRRAWSHFAAAVLVGLLPWFFTTCHRSPGAPVPVVAAEAAVPTPVPMVPAAPPEPPVPVVPPPSGPWDKPAPACVTQLVKQQVEKVGPGVVEVSCEGKHYRCVATVVRDQVAFNCAELTDEAPEAKSPTASPPGGISL